MKPYIFTARDGIHIFDLVKTKKGLEEAAAFAKATAAEGGAIIFIGTKRQAQDIVREVATRIDTPYVTERWIGGLITNWEELKKRTAHLADLKAGKAEGRFKDRTKKENLLIDREIVKMEKIFGGVADLKQLPAAIFVIDAKKEAAALKEAKMRGVATIAIADTNVDPVNIDYIIPANDDAAKSIQLICDVMVEAIEEGKKLPKEEVKNEKLEVSKEGESGDEGEIKNQKSKIKIKTKKSKVRNTKK